MSWRNLQRVLVSSSEDLVTTRWVLSVFRCIIDVLKAFGAENKRFLRPARRRRCFHFSAKLLWSTMWLFCCKSGSIYPIYRWYWISLHFAFRRCGSWHVAVYDLRWGALILMLHWGLQTGRSRWLWFYSQSFDYVLYFTCYRTADH